MGIGEVYAHRSIENINQVLRANGILIPNVKTIDPTISRKKLSNALILAPPSSLNSPWINKFSPSSIAVASGWMSLRGARRKRNIDRGFIISDHADWEQLKTAVKESGAKTVYVTHGYSSSFSRWLNENGFQSKEIKTKFIGEMEEMSEGFLNATE
jgi:putative mRNA 3-end processing factor